MYLTFYTHSLCLQALAIGALSAYRIDTSVGLVRLATHALKMVLLFYSWLSSITHKHTLSLSPALFVALFTI